MIMRIPPLKIKNAWYELQQWRSLAGERRNGPTVALVTVARNEERFLKEFLQYHHCLGVSKAYVYLDRCTDRCHEIATAFPFVECQLVDAKESGCVNVSALHRFCSQDALSRCRQAGIEWLLMIDADEFAFADNVIDKTDVGHGEAKPSVVELNRRGYLPTLLKNVPDDIEMVKMKTREVVPTQKGAAGLFWEHRYVQKTPVSRQILDPRTGEIVILDKFIGHRLGKSFVRTSADVQLYNSHSWTRNQDVSNPQLLPIPQTHRGFHLHYVICDAEHWKSKYRQLAWEPSRWANNALVPFPKQCWKEISQTMDDDAVEDYLNQWLFVDEGQLRHMISNNEAEFCNVVEQVLMHRSEVVLKNLFSRT